MAHTSSPTWRTTIHIICRIPLFLCSIALLAILGYIVSKWPVDVGSGYNTDFAAACLAILADPLGIFLLLRKPSYLSTVLVLDFIVCILAGLSIPAMSFVRFNPSRYSHSHAQVERESWADAVSVAYDLTILVLSRVLNPVVSSLALWTFRGADPATPWPIVGIAVALIYLTAGRVIGSNYSTSSWALDSCDPYYSALLIHLIGQDFPYLELLQTNYGMFVFPCLWTSFEINKSRIVLGVHIGTQADHSLNMATVQDFEAVKKHQEWTWTLDEYDQHLEEWFPDEEDRLAYGRWSMEKGKEEHNRMRYDREDWGYLKLEEDVKQQQFSCARIANRLSDLELFKPFSMTEIVNHPVEIVYAVTTAQRTMIRATIASL